MPRRGAIRIASLVAAAACAFAAGAQDIPPLVARSIPAVVTISDEASGQGSGFVVSADGRIVTSLHVIARMQRPRVTLASGEVFDQVTVLIYDPDRDLAVIKVPASGLRALRLGDSSRLRVGQRVLAIGAPRGLSGTTTSGIVSALRAHPKIPGATLLQTDAAINFGNSGGPLVNTRGEAVGVVVSLIRDANNLSFAVPSNDLRSLLQTAGGAYSVEQVRKFLLATDWAGVVLPRRWRADSDFYLGKGAGAIYDLSDAGPQLQLAFQRPAAEAQLGARLSFTLVRQGGQFQGSTAGQVDCETLRESKKLPWSHGAAKINLLALDRLELTFFAPGPPDVDGDCRLAFKQFGLTLVPATERDATPSTGEAEHLDTIRKRRTELQARREQLRRTCREVRDEIATTCARTPMSNASSCKIFGDIAVECTREGF